MVDGLWLLGALLLERLQPGAELLRARVAREGDVECVENFPRFLDKPLVEEKRSLVAFGAGGIFFVRRGNRHQRSTFETRGYRRERRLRAHGGRSTASRRHLV